MIGRSPPRADPVHLFNASSPLVGL